jgi:L-aspartate oxidase
MHADVVIVGAGLAGLSTALALDGRSVLLVNDTAPASEVASAWAQGGVAAALAPDDTPALHEADTLAAAAGLADPATVHALAEEAPDVVALLARLGVPFDRDGDGALALGLEAAHSRRRIAHAADRTGAAIVRALLAVVAARPEIRLVTGWRALDLIVRDDGRVGGVVFADAHGRTQAVTAGSVVLASGGFGGVYARTTTPRATLGAGIVMAARAGATLVDLEFVQFHPTALRIDADPLPLVSEAVRGEGARLLDGDGNRFVDELAPRDVVARAIAAVEVAGGTVALDARAALGASFARHFPGIAAECAAHGIDPATMPIPVTPAAHYTIGGIATDARGRSSVPGLWACGEVAATGLHGANRLASNSLMEAAVFGARVARDIAGARAPRALGAVAAVADVAFSADLAAELAPLRAAMSAYAGVVRDAAGLTALVAVCDRLDPVTHDPRVRDAVALARFVAHAALARRESRGAHVRRDFPASDPRFAVRAFVGAAELARSS